MAPPANEYKSGSHERVGNLLHLHIRLIMPAFYTPLLDVVGRDAPATNATNATSAALQVVCAFPVSGQYGPGSRVLYYILIAACVFARKSEWLRNACLAAALIFPAVAALHGIVLAALHVENAVDMDIYGAFQLCSIGILAAPVTVRLSQTYFNNPGRNTIFVWTILILAGLLSLTVEFFRVRTFNCTHDDSGAPISVNPLYFPYEQIPSCGLNCTVDDGPFSPMRQGSANNVYVIPAPDKLTFGTATLLAAGCCIPAILSLVSMWNKILEINWKSRFANRDENKQAPIQGTNGATIETMTRVNSLIRRFLSVVEIPVFGAAIFLILILGELNFFSTQVDYQTEPISSIGQWAPLVGTALAVLGSLYVLLVKEEANPDDSANKSHPAMPETGRSLSPASSIPVASPSAIDAGSVITPSAIDMRRSHSDGGSGRTPHEVVSTSNLLQRVATSEDAGNRRRVARGLIAIGNRLGTAGHDQFDMSEFRSGEALNYPQVPGEELRNPELFQIRDRYNLSQDADGVITPVLRRQHSRSASFTSSVASGNYKENSSTSRAPSPRRPKVSTLSAERTSSELQDTPSYSSTGANGRRPRRDTLEVPSSVSHGTARNTPSDSIITSFVTRPYGQSSPTIMVSDSDTPFPVHAPVSSAYTPTLQSEPLPGPTSDSP